MDKDLIKQIKDSPYFEQLQEYINSKINELNSLDGLEGLSNEQAGEEAKARVLALNKLWEILKPFIEQREKREPTTEEIQKAKEKYGV
jgi:hypothetical protein